MPTLAYLSPPSGALVDNPKEEGGGGGQHGVSLAPVAVALLGTKAIEGVTSNSCVVPAWAHLCSHPAALVENPTESAGDECQHGIPSADIALTPSGTGVVGNAVPTLRRSTRIAATAKTSSKASGHMVGVATPRTGPGSCWRVKCVSADACDVVSLFWTGELLYVADGNVLGAICWTK